MPWQLPPDCDCSPFRFAASSCPTPPCTDSHLPPERACTAPPPADATQCTGTSCRVRRWRCGAPLPPAARRRRLLQRPTLQPQAWPRLASTSWGMHHSGCMTTEPEPQVPEPQVQTGIIAAVWAASGRPKLRSNTCVVLHLCHTQDDEGVETPDWCPVDVSLVHRTPPGCRRWPPSP